MCVTNIYTDLYPDGRTSTFRQTIPCIYGLPGRPCPSASTIENPVRKINFGEPTTEHIIKHNNFLAQPRPHTPPRSPASSHQRHSSSESSSREHSGHKRRPSKKLSPLRPTRQHRKERIIIVDSPPTPRTPPQAYNQTFTAPSSPSSPRFRTSMETSRGRPIIVDERPLRRARDLSASAVVSERPSRRSTSSHRSQVVWDSPSSSHTSFNSRLRREEEEAAFAREQRFQDRQREQDRLMRREIEARERLAKLDEAERKKSAWIKAQDEEIRRRPAVPLPTPAPILKRSTTKEQRDGELVSMMGGLSVRDERRETRESEEAMKRRLKERQLPGRRFSVGMGGRRPRDSYSEGMYRWE